jgi:hypothetical protein
LVVLSVVVVVVLSVDFFCCPLASEDVEEVVESVVVFLWWCFFLVLVVLVESVLEVSCPAVPAVLPVCEFASWPDWVLVVEVVVLVEPEGVAVLCGVAVLSCVEGDVVEVPAALPVALWEAAPAGCAQGWLLVLPVALPVAPPAGEAGVIEDGFCAGAAGWALCEAAPVWSVVVVLVVLDWLCVCAGVALWSAVAGALVLACAIARPVPSNRTEVA